MNVRNFVANCPLIRLALLDLLPIVGIMSFLMVCCHSGLANTTIFSISFSWKIELPIDRLPCLGLVSSREGHFERLTAPFTSLILTLCFVYLRKTESKNTRFMCPFGRLIVTKPTSILHGPILGIDHLLGT